MNKKISKEYLYELSIIKSHAIGITFIPDSLGCKIYGSNIVVDLDLDDSEFEILTKNYFSKPPINTYGKIRAKALVKDKLTNEQIERLNNEGFDTEDIFEIRHL